MVAELGWAPTDVRVGWASTEDRFRAMGTDCHVVVVGPAGRAHLAYARDRIDSLERLWSRFRPDSEISRLNSTLGSVAIAEETFSLIEHAVLAQKLTGGRFDPRMGRQLAALGYDRSFEQLGEQTAGPDRSSARIPVGVTVRGHCGSISLERDRLAVQLPSGVGFDPGGIGKGFAADLVSQELMARGAWGVLVNLGGDLRVRGNPARGEAWVITIAEPTVCEDPITTVRLVDCGLATSTTRRRRWSTDGEQHHHLLDPATGFPHETPVDLVTVVAGDAWWAEAAATALIANDEQLVEDVELVPTNCAALRVFSDGRAQRLASFERYEHE